MAKTPAKTAAKAAAGVAARGRPAAGKGGAKGPARGRPARGVARGGAARGGAGAKAQAALAAQNAPLLSPTNRIVALLVGLAVVPFALPTILLLLIGMLPTLAAVFAERGSSRQAWVSVGGLNFAGLANWLLSLWFGHHTLGYAIQILRTVTPLLVAYGAAALGWALYLAMPPLVNAITTVTSQRRVVTLAAQQRKLVEIWGDPVISRENRNGDKPADAPAAAPLPNPPPR